MANEEETAAGFVTAVLDACADAGMEDVRMYVVLDRVSRDRTRARLEEHAQTEPRLCVVWAPETRGVAEAYVRGYREALDSGSDWVLEIDAGFSHDPAQIPEFLSAMSGGAVDCVFGTRFSHGGANRATLRRRLISRGGTVLSNALLGTRLSDMTSGYELFTRSALETVLKRGIRSRGPFFQTEIKAHCRHFRFAEIPITYAAGSHAIAPAALSEALANLGQLAVRRLRGQL
jgi:dolichol-phosphate mannosyltransferase